MKRVGRDLASSARRTQDSRASSFLRDVIARLTRALEAIEDGDNLLAEGIVVDLLPEFHEHLRIAEHRERLDQ